MKLIQALFIGLTGTIIGAFIGFYLAGHRYADHVTDTITTHEFIDAAETLTTLKDMRAGDTNSVFESLENRLDMAVIFADAFLEEDPMSERSRNWERWLRRVADYRAAHPYQSDITNVTAAVTDVLAGVRLRNQ
jgi:hypothetical protein